MRWSHLIFFFLISSGNLILCGELCGWRKMWESETNEQIPQKWEKANLTDDEWCVSRYMIRWRVQQWIKSVSGYTDLLLYYLSHIIFVCYSNIHLYPQLQVHNFMLCVYLNSANYGKDLKPFQLVFFNQESFSWLANHIHTVRRQCTPLHQMNTAHWAKLLLVYLHIHSLY